MKESIIWVIYCNSKNILKLFFFSLIHLRVVQHWQGMAEK